MIETKGGEAVATLSARDVCVHYGSRQVLTDVSLSAPDGRITVILGANGCGKSTLLRALARLIPVSRGEVLFGGRSASSFTLREWAQRVGLLPQAPTCPSELTVRQLVSFGRYPHRSFAKRMGPRDWDAVTRALRATDLVDKQDEPLSALSGGQRQRAWIAMALAQETEILLLDEPTTYLDLAHGLDVMELVTDLNRTHGRTIVMVLHDLHLAARFADWMVAMREGRVVAQGKPGEVVTPGVLREVFEIDAEIEWDGRAERPVIRHYERWKGDLCRA